MTELFAPSIDEQIACVDREIAMRRRVYERRVADGRMPAGRADREIETMLAVRRTLIRVKEGDHATSPEHRAD